MSQWVVQVSMYSMLLAAHSCCADIHVGGALNIFRYFGDLSSVVKVNPSHGADWFYDQDSVDVFEEVLETRSTSLPTNDAIFNGDFHLELCDNLGQLEEAYFRYYNIERSESPWRAFAGGWSNTLAARHLGLNSSFVRGSHGYALVRLSRHHELVRLAPHMGLRLSNWTAKHIGTVVPGQASSVLDFIQVFGSHYVSSYITGDSLYQVFVFTPSVYAEVKKVTHDSLGLEQVLSFFTPWHVEHMGQVLSSSGNSSLEHWATRNLHSRILMFHYSSLLKLHSAPQLLQDLNYLLGNDALLSVDLKTLAPLFKDEKKRLWFEEVLDNHLKMWELNV